MQPSNLHYTVGGLTVRSALEIPELRPCPQPERVDLAIEVGPVSWEAADPHDHTPYRVEPGCLLLEAPGVARYRIRAGVEIRVEPLKTGPAADQDVRIFLLGAALGVACQQRGLLPLHAGAVNVGGRGVAFMGPCGAGKSTLAASLAQRGYRLLSDDVCVAGGEPLRLYPGVPQLKLWRDGLHILSRHAGGLRRVQAGLDKFQIPAWDRFEERPLAPWRVYELVEGAVGDLRIEPLHGLEAVAAVSRNIYSPRAAKAAGLEEENFRRCGALANTVEIYRLVRPRDLRLMDGVIDHLEQHWAVNSKASSKPSQTRLAAQTAASCPAQEAVL